MLTSQSGITSYYLVHWISSRKSGGTKTKGTGKQLPRLGSALRVRSTRSGTAAPRGILRSRAGQGIFPSQIYSSSPCGGSAAGAAKRGRGAARPRGPSPLAATAAPARPKCWIHRPLRTCGQAAAPPTPALGRAPTAARGCRPGAPATPRPYLAGEGAGEGPGTGAGPGRARGRAARPRSPGTASAAQVTWQACPRGAWPLPRMREERGAGLAPPWGRVGAVHRRAAVVRVGPGGAPKAQPDRVRAP